MPRLQAMDGVVSTVNGKQTILYPIDAAAPAALTEVVRTIALRRELPNDSIDPVMELSLKTEIVLRLGQLMLLLFFTLSILEE